MELLSTSPTSFMSSILLHPAWMMVQAAGWHKWWRSAKLWRCGAARSTLQKYVKTEAHDAGNASTIVKITRQISFQFNWSGVKYLFF
jgi:hypothetical protein